MEAITIGTQSMVCTDLSRHDVIRRVGWAAALVLMGAAIYILFRDKTILVFHWADSLHMGGAIDHVRSLTQDVSVPDFVKFCVPDGLWLGSSILLMDAVWHGEDLSKQLFWTLLLPVISIISEIMQYYGWLVGTYDVGDLFCYMVPVVLYLIYKYDEKVKH